MSKLIAASDSDDAPVSFVNISEPRLSRTKPDQKHPFDHGQTEYMTSAIVIALVVHIGIETQISSIQHLVSVKTKTDCANKALPGSLNIQEGFVYGTDNTVA
ncbi:cation transporter [Faecalibaculum rodentium]|uniref:cation transporter n=2 Tax=Faecalibaculum rodentium TaxID=1702221 RepID=UPI00262F6C7C|nr:cation transporter [Faecalibaculum rodentium]